jgi:hypothetical protein
MQKKGMIVVGILLAAILCMQVILLSKVKTLRQEMLSCENFASQRIDVMTGNQHKLQNTLDEILEELQSER